MLKTMKHKQNKLNSTLQSHIKPLTYSVVPLLVLAGADSLILVVVVVAPPLASSSSSADTPYIAQSSCDAALCLAFFLLGPFPVPLLLYYNKTM